MIAVLIGPLVAVWRHSARPVEGNALRVAAGVSATLLAAILVVAGLAVLLGAVAVLVVPLLLAAAGWWAWRHDRTDVVPSAGPPNQVGLHTAPMTGPKPPTRPAMRIPAIAAGSASTTQLCAIWQQTYWLLHDLAPDSPDRRVVVEIRERLLEEFERRDPDGFGRWLHTDPRACSDPGRYLRADH